MNFKEQKIIDKMKIAKKLYDEYNRYLAKGYKSVDASKRLSERFNIAPRTIYEYIRQYKEYIKA